MSDERDLGGRNCQSSRPSDSIRHGEGHDHLGTSLSTVFCLQQCFHLDDDSIVVRLGVPRGTKINHATRFAMTAVLLDGRLPRYDAYGISARSRDTDSIIPSTYIVFRAKAAHEIPPSSTSSNYMSQAKDDRPSGYGQIRLFDSDGDPVNLEAAPPRRTYGPGIFRRIGMLLGYIAFCAGAFLVVGHYRSSGSSHHLPPARDLCVPQASSRLHPEDLVYEDDPLSSLLTKSGNCTTPREEQWVFIDAEGCGHSFTRGAERFQSSASTSFTLPVRDKEAIQLSSRGNARMAGVAHIALAEDITQEDVQIDVTMYMHDKELFEKTVKVCRATGPLALFGERLSLHAVCTGYFV